MNPKKELLQYGLSGYSYGLAYPNTLRMQRGHEQPLQRLVERAACCCIRRA